jgi:hypothetical protein
VNDSKWVPPMLKYVVETVTDRDNVDHQLARQADWYSCGPTSIFMAECNFKMRSCAGGELRLTQIAARYGYDPDSGIDDDGTMDTMRHVGLPLAGYVTRSSNLLKLNRGRIHQNRPAVVAIGWYTNSGEPAGGHLVVAARVNGIGQIVYLDPWYAMNECANDGTYPVLDDVGKVDSIFYTA